MRVGGPCVHISTDDEGMEEVAHRVVAGDGEGDLELLRQIGTAIQGLNRMASDDTITVVVSTDLTNT